MKRTITLGTLALLATLLLAGGSFAHEGNIAVDGVVQNEEYENHYANEDLNMNLHWTIDTEDGVIFIALESPDTGWVGIGFDAADGQSMDWVIGAFHDEDGETDALDAFQAPANDAAQADTFLGGNSDLLERAAVQTERGTTFEFARKLDTGDAFDVALKPGVQGVMLAFGDEDEYEHFHDETRRMVRVDFFAGTVSTGEEK